MIDEGYIKYESHWTQGPATHVEAARQHLVKQSRGLPHYLEIKHRYAVEDDESFEMLPGFENFSPIKEGQVVARDISGDIKAKEDGIMLFPRYQPGGEDGPA